MTAKPRGNKSQDTREWYRTSVDAPENPKFIELGDWRPHAFLAYSTGLAYARASRTRGYVSPSHIIGKAGVPAFVATLLTGQGLWHLPSHTCDRCPQPPAGQVYIHDYPQHQDMPETVAALSAKRSEAGKRGAAAKWAKDKPAPQPPEPPAQMASAIANDTAKPITKFMGDAPASAMALAIPFAEQVPWQTHGREEKKRKELKPPPPPLEDQQARAVDTRSGGGKDDLETKRILDLVDQVISARNRTLDGEPELEPKGWTPLAIARVLARKTVATHSWDEIVIAAMIVARDLESTAFARLGAMGSDAPWWAQARRELDAKHRRAVVHDTLPATAYHQFEVADPRQPSICWCDWDDANERHRKHRTLATAA